MMFKKQRVLKGTFQSKFVQLLKEHKKKLYIFLQSLDILSNKQCILKDRIKKRDGAETIRPQANFVSTLEDDARAIVVPEEVFIPSVLFVYFTF